MPYQASLAEPWFARQNTLGETKQAWYAAEEYQKGTISIYRTQIQPKI